MAFFLENIDTLRFSCRVSQVAGDGCKDIRVVTTLCRLCLRLLVIPERGKYQIMSRRDDAFSCIICKEAGLGFLDPFPSATRGRQRMALFSLLTAKYNKNRLTQTNA